MVETPLIRHGFAVPPSPLWGEGSRPTQIGWNCSHCGTFGYIYWELGRSAPVGGGASRVGAPHPPRIRSAPFPKGEGLRASRCAAPTTEEWYAQAVRPGGRALQRGWREPAPSSAPFGGTFPPGGRHDGRVSVPAPTPHLRTALHTGKGTSFRPVPYNAEAKRSFAENFFAYFLFQRK